MERRDLLWLGVKLTGLFFVAKAILVLPDLIFAIRAEELLYGRAAEVIPHFMLGTGALATELGVYTLAAVLFLLVPAGRG